MNRPSGEPSGIAAGETPADTGPTQEIPLHVRLHKWIHVFRFLVVGGINTLFGYCLFAFLIWIRLPPEIALALSTVIAVMFNFLTYGKLVFNRLNRSSLPRYIIVYVVSYGINAALLRFSLNTLHFSPYLTQIMLLPFMTLAMFFVLRYFVFRPRG